MDKLWPYIAGILACAPVLLFIAGFGVPDSLFWSFGMVAVAGGWFSTILFAIYAGKSKRVPSSKRALWIALIILGNAVVLPFFWYWYVWKQETTNDVHT